MGILDFLGFGGDEPVPAPHPMEGLLTGEEQILWDQASRTGDERTLRMLRSTANQRAPNAEGLPRAMPQPAFMATMPGSMGLPSGADAAPQVDIGAEILQLEDIMGGTPDRPVGPSPDEVALDLIKDNLTQSVGFNVPEGKEMEVGEGGVREVGGRQLWVPGTKDPIRTTPEAEAGMRKVADRLGQVFAPAPPVPDQHAFGPDAINRPGLPVVPPEPEVIVPETAGSVLDNIQTTAVEVPKTEVGLPDTTSTAEGSGKVDPDADPGGKTGNPAKAAGLKEDGEEAERKLNKIQQMAQDRFGWDEDKRNAMSRALMAAGFGMMAGDSQYAMQNIGKGGLAGVAAYGNAKEEQRQAGLDEAAEARAEEAAARAAEKHGVAMDEAERRRQDHLRKLKEYENPKPAPYDPYENLSDDAATIMKIQELYRTGQISRADRDAMLGAGGV